MQNLNNKYYSYLTKLFYEWYQLKTGYLDWSLECDIKDYNIWAVLEMLKNYEKNISETNIIYKITDYNIIEYDNANRIIVAAGLWKKTKDTTEYVKLKIIINIQTDEYKFEIGV